MLRNFVTRAEAIGMDYNIVEAIDQPWKFFEGGVGPVLGRAQRRPRAEIRLDRPDRERELLEARDRSPSWSACSCRCRSCGWTGPPSMQALVLSAAANGVGAWVATVFSYWDRALFRVRLGLCADPGPDPAGSPGPDRDGADRGDRRHCLRPRPAAADQEGRGPRTCHHRRDGRVPKSLDPHPRLFRAGRDAEADA